MSWQKMAMSSLSAARLLQRMGLHRSSISRAYYAGFAATVNEIRKHTTIFPKGYEHPPHPQVGGFIKKHLAVLPKQDMDDLRDALARLRGARLDADYRHKAALGDLEARNAVRDAQYVLNALEAL